MELTRRYLERLMPQSTFGLTLLTIAGVIIVLGFFARGIHLASVEGKLPEGYVRMVPDNFLPARESDRRSGTSQGGRKIPLDLPPDESWGAWAKPSGPIGRIPSPSSPRYVATLTRTHECRWAEGSIAPKDGSQLRVGQTLNLAAGLAEIVFTCGAKAILQGPAVLELHSDKVSTLRSGRMTADVPDNIQGFTVQTPTVQIVSLTAEEQKSVARLSDVADCSWDKEGKVAKGAYLQPSQRLKLLTGLAEVTFHNGAKVILQGPADFEIESDKTAILHVGRVTANVPDDLEGFKIRTPVAEILSLPVAKSDPPEDKKPEAPPDKETNSAPDTVVVGPGETARVETPAEKPSAAPLPAAEVEEAPEQPKDSEPQ